MFVCKEEIFPWCAILEAYNCCYMHQVYQGCKQRRFGRSPQYYKREDVHSANLYHFVPREKIWKTRCLHPWGIYTI